MATSADNPFAGDRGPVCTVVIDGVEYPTREWALDDDVIEIGDVFSCDIPNVDLATGKDGALSGKIKVGAKLEVYEADPAVAGGAKVLQLLGLVTDVRHTSDSTGGSVIRIIGADLGWHYGHSSAPPLKSLRNLTFASLFDLLTDKSWGVKGLRESNAESRASRLGLLNTRLSQGRVGAAQQVQPQLGAVLAPIQTEPGDLPSEILVRYARRARRLVNMSHDGWLMIYSPRTEGDLTSVTEPVWKIEYHGTSAKLRNNVLQARVSEKLEPIYSDLDCYSTTLIPPAISDSENPNEQYRKSHFTAPAGTLPFKRLLVFSEPDAITPAMRENRVKWRWQRGIFDSWQYMTTVRGHSQGGAFFVTDTIGEIDDTFHNVRGKFYLRGAKRSYTVQGGCRTDLTFHKLGVLGG